MKYSCIILAAGKSSRMKQQKMLLPFAGSTVIEQVVNASLQSDVDSTIVVMGSHEDLIREQLKTYKLKLIHNTNFESGMLSSVQCGVNVLGNSDAFLVLPGDQPLVKSSTINNLVKAYEKSTKSLMIPTFNGRKGHPVVIDANYAKQIMHLDPNIGLRQLFHNNENDIEFLALNTEEILIDLDFPEDYKKALNELNEKE